MFRWVHAALPPLGPLGLGQTVPLQCIAGLPAVAVARRVSPVVVLQRDAAVSLAPPADLVYGEEAWVGGIPPGARQGPQIHEASGTSGYDSLLRLALHERVSEKCSYDGEREGTESAKADGGRGTESAGRSCETPFKNRC